MADFSAGTALLCWCHSFHHGTHTHTTHTRMHTWSWTPLHQACPLPGQRLPLDPVCVCVCARVYATQGESLFVCCLLLFLVWCGRGRGFFFFVFLFFCFFFLFFLLFVHFFSFFFFFFFFSPRSLLLSFYMFRLLAGAFHSTGILDGIVLISLLWSSPRWDNWRAQEGIARAIYHMYHMYIIIAHDTRPRRRLLQQRRRLSLCALAQ